MHITVDEAAFDRGRGEVRVAVERLRTTRTRADQRVAGFLDTGWRGEAAAAFASAWTDWSESALAVERCLAAIGELMDATRVALHRCDRATAQHLEVVGVRIVDRLGR